MLLNLGSASHEMRRWVLFYKNHRKFNKRTGLPTKTLKHLFLEKKNNSMTLVQEKKIGKALPRKKMGFTH